MDIISSAAIEAGPHYNEASVRFHIVDPLLRKLGYPNYENTYLELEEKLEYPYIHIGRRSKKDVPLGFPDYRAGLKGARGSFIVESKAGSNIITDRDVEQAHSYAAHSQVGANYFVLSNGVEIRIYETLAGPNNNPIVAVPISQLDELYHQIENILSPTNLEKNCKIEYDQHLKLCDGLRSSIYIRSGAYKISSYDFRILFNGLDQTELFRANAPQIAQLDQQMDLLKNVLELRVEEGSVTRDENGRITAYARFGGATLQNAEAMRVIGIDEISFKTSEEFLSTDFEHPTMFDAAKDFSVSKGAMIPLLLGGVGAMNSDVEGDLFITVSMYFDGRDLVGQYRSFTDYNIKLPFPGALTVEMDITGTFTLRPDL